ncbi:MAG: acyltransferase [Clostridiales bacterium]|nr:acyltransferase [Clostridiales bacterium]
MTLKDAVKGRENNLDLIRFIAAVLVIVGHAYPLCIGPEGRDILSQLTTGKSDMSFGGLAVTVFFFYGGYLIAGSANSKKTAKEYFKARILRIFPPLIFVTLILAFLAGPFLTEMTVGGYFTSIGTYKYLLNSFLIPIHELPGVFTKSPYNPTVNGALWTLPIEFCCYIACFVVYKMGILSEEKQKAFAVTAVLAVLGIIASNLILPLPLVATIRSAIMFYMGMLCYVYRDKIEIKPLYAILALVLFAATVPFGIFKYTCFICLPYIYMYIGFGTKVKFSNFAKYGEVSYGMYLCGYPIQQILCQVSGYTMGPVLNFVLGTVLSVAAGFLVYYNIERPVMRLQKKKG